MAMFAKIGMNGKVIDVQTVANEINRVGYLETIILQYTRWNSLRS